MTVKTYAIVDRNGAPPGLRADYVQVRAKELSARALLELTRCVVAGQRAPVLVNARVDVALAAGAAGVHLPSESIAPVRIRRIVPPGFLIAVSCHGIAELQRAEDESADFAVFGPVFPTRSHPEANPVGLDALRAACAAVRMPVYALGGVTLANAGECMAAGAAGIAGLTFWRSGST